MNRPERTFIGAESARRPLTKRERWQRAVTWWCILVGGFAFWLFVAQAVRGLLNGWLG